jgi:hypothetical protein
MAPIVGRFPSFYRGDISTRRSGAIAQLGERVVRNDEVGGSIPPGSTTLRPSGFAWRSHEMPEGQSVVPGEAQRAKTGRHIIFSFRHSAIK